ncbi:MAG: type I methionyl aminopeptidase [Parcubacteria group bacterium]|nr:type I methionyl aminopeptidase [Parcubacteria group bacterium]
MIIPAKKTEIISVMREAGKILAGVIQEVGRAANVGVALKELDELAESLIRKAGCRPAFLGYRPEGARKPYPATICASVNEVVVHGVPNSYRLKDGDILKLDFGLVYPPKGGFYVDAAVTVPIGKVSKKAELLIAVTRDALMKGIAQATVGKRLGDVGAAIQKHVEKNGFSVIRGLTGHGIGVHLHEDPPVYNYGKPDTGVLLQPGMVFAIEPMVALGSGEITQLPDDSFATQDGSLSAHFEHTVAVTARGPEVLTAE